MKKTTALVTGLLLATAGLFSAPGFADEKNIPEVFRGETRGSPIQIRYDDWTAILRSTVIDSGTAGRELASAPEAQIGTRVVRGNMSRTRNEGNRLLFPAYTEENIAFLHKIRTELEKVPDQAPMNTWTKNEQLAYWLNLYNMTLIELLAEEYPVQSLKKLREGSKKHPSPWKRKVLTVAGENLSLDDIHKILIEKWDSTLVMYGLFQGFVGGPNVRQEAYTGDQVHRQLVDNAKEFVNSNRGMRPVGSSLEISTLYKENEALFPNWEEDLKKHFISLTDSGLHSRIRNAKKIKAKTKDYFIADLFGGDSAVGSSAATNEAALYDSIVHVNAGKPAAAGSSNGISNFSFENYSGMPSTDIGVRFPPHVVDYLRQMRKNKAAKQGQVEIEEVDEGKTEETPK
ncbi:DUF547 domain-containing protein [Kordiimonas sp.]|uniref:DUF547 domain-containing protein n=1 Tax=Kordiimonas sp. TaxID=1970157 RepID=UPI003A8E66B8